MMDHYQIWFHGTAAGIIYHSNNPINASLQSDQSSEFKTQHGRIWRSEDHPLSKLMSSNGGGGQVSQKEIMTLVADWSENNLLT